MEALETFRPTIDQTEFAKNPLNLFREGNWQTYKELIIGSNIDEFVVLTERVLRNGVDFELFKVIACFIRQSSFLVIIS